MGAIALRITEFPADNTALVREAQRGNVAAFERLYREHVGRVFAICMRISGERSRAEDLTQEVFIRAWNKLDSFTAGTNLSAWLRKIALNTSLGERRSAARRSARELTVEQLPETAPDQPAPVPGAGVDLERAIATLPPSAREVFVLHDVEGYRHREIAQLLGVATGTSKAQLHRARNLLRKVL